MARSLDPARASARARRKPSRGAGDWLPGIALGAGGARRFATVDASRLPTLVRVEAECLKLDFVQQAKPENQPDAVTS